MKKLPVMKVPEYYQNDPSGYNIPQICEIAWLSLAHRPGRETPFEHSAIAHLG